VPSQTAGLDGIPESRGGRGVRPAPLPQSRRALQQLATASAAERDRRSAGSGQRRPRHSLWYRSHRQLSAATISPRHRGRYLGRHADSGPAQASAAAAGARLSAGGRELPSLSLPQRPGRPLHPISPFDGSGGTVRRADRAGSSGEALGHRRIPQSRSTGQSPQARDPLVAPARGPASQTHRLRHRGRAAAERAQRPTLLLRQSMVLRQRPRRGQTLYAGPSAARGI